MDVRPDAVVMGDLNLLRAVGRAGLRSLAVSSDPKVRRSRFSATAASIPQASTDMEASVEALLAIGWALEQEFGDDRPVLYYSNDAQLLMVSRYREALARYFRFLLPDAALVQRLVDKEQFQGLAEELALPTPRRLPWPRAAGDPPPAFPCVIKPASRVGWFDTDVVETLHGVPHKVLKITNADALAFWTGAMHRAGRRFLLQEFIGGGDDQIFSFHAYLDRHGEPLASFVGRKVRTYPLDTGRSTYLELAHEPDLRAAAVAIARELGLVGVMKMDFKRDPRTGAFYLLEINARFNLWHYLGAVCGVNLPAVAHADLTGRPIPPPREGALGVRWLNLREDIKSGRSGVRAGRWDVWQWLASYRGRKVYTVMAWDDPGPALYSAFRWWRKRLHRRVAGGRRRAS